MTRRASNQPDATPHKSPYADPLVAAVYARVAAPIQFGPPAHDLVEILQLHNGAVVLDIGTGTGAVARAAGAVVGSSGLVIGVDASIEMLRFARESPRNPVAAAQITGLPFRNGVFHAVTAGFVVSHLADYGSGLAELRRVCRGGGRVAVTAWGALPNAASGLWSDTAGTFVPRGRLEEAFRAHIPWDEYFSHRVNLQRAMDAAGLTSVMVETREYEITMRTADFLLSREASVQGQLLRQLLSDEQWKTFGRQAADLFQHEFGEAVTYRRDVRFAVGTKSRH